MNKQTQEEFVSGTLIYRPPTEKECLSELIWWMKKYRKTNFWQIFKKMEYLKKAKSYSFSLELYYEPNTTNK